MGSRHVPGTLQIRTKLLKAPEKSLHYHVGIIRQIVIQLYIEYHWNIRFLIVKNYFSTIKKNCNKKVKKIDSLIPIKKHHRIKQINKNGEFINSFCFFSEIKLINNQVARLRIRNTCVGQVSMPNMCVGCSTNQNR